MVSRRLSIIACALAAVSFAACSSSKKTTGTTKGATTTTTTISIPQVITSQVTTTTQVSATLATIPPSLTTPGVTSTTSPTEPRTVSSPSDNVKLGDSGPGVQQIQQALKQACYKITVDGQFGAATQKDVEDFQTKNGLKADGVVGPKTWAKLKVAKCATGGSATTTTVKKGTTTTTTIKKGTTTTTTIKKP